MVNKTHTNIQIISNAVVKQIFILYFSTKVLNEKVCDFGQRKVVYFEGQMCDNCVELNSAVSDSKVSHKPNSPNPSIDLDVV